MSDPNCYSNVDLKEIPVAIIIYYDRIIDPTIGETFTIQETLHGTIAKYRSMKWNRLSLRRTASTAAGQVIIARRMIDSEIHLMGTPNLGISKEKSDIYHFSWKNPN